MARGFESKDVEFQQAEAERGRTFKRPLTPAEREAQNKRRTLELALSRARADRDITRSEAHRHMLDAAVSELEAQLALIAGPGTE
jgi:predicted ArsR family transcriptional regulator